MSEMFVLAYSDRSFIEREKMNAARNKLTKQCLQGLREKDPEELAKNVTCVAVSGCICLVIWMHLINNN